MENVRKAATRFPILQDIEARSGGVVRKEYSLILAGLLLFLLTLATPLGPLLTSTFGVIIPLKETLTILKQVNPKPEEVKHLLVFWVLFGLLTALDAYSSWLVGFIPLFYTLKFAFLAWAGPLKFKAGMFLYDNLISKIPETYYSFDTPEESIRSAAMSASEQVKNISKSEKPKEIGEAVGAVRDAIGDLSKKNQ